jgi:hypothetical protein
VKDILLLIAISGTVIGIVCTLVLLLVVTFGPSITAVGMPEIFLSLIDQRLLNAEFLC